MEIVAHSKKSVSTSFKINCTISTGIPDQECNVKNDPIGLLVLPSQGKFRPSYNSAPD